LTLFSHPEIFLPQLQTLLSSPNAATRSTVVSAIKFTFSTSNQHYDTLLAPLVFEFLLLLKDNDAQVRKATLSTLNAAAYFKPSFIRLKLQEILPLLYSETIIREELIKIVEMGPFKHRVDSGENARKMAYECMNTLLGKYVMFYNRQLFSFDPLDRVLGCYH
jgi:cullin-associated NEDD8-dissociated protein 1